MESDPSLRTMPFIFTSFVSKKFYLGTHLKSPAFDDVCSDAGFK